MTGLFCDIGTAKQPQLPNDAGVVSDFMTGHFLQALHLGTDSLLGEAERLGRDRDAVLIGDAGAHLHQGRIQGLTEHWYFCEIGSSSRDSAAYPELPGQARSSNLLHRAMGATQNDLYQRPRTLVLCGRKTAKWPWRGRLPPPAKTQRAANFLAMIHLASMRLWLRAYESTA